MDANPAPTLDRLRRAENLVMEAALAGAQLVVLGRKNVNIQKVFEGWYAPLVNN